jgi:hypothetical protein
MAVTRRGEEEYEPAFSYTSDNRCVFHWLRTFWVAFRARDYALGKPSP